MFRHFNAQTLRSVSASGQPSQQPDPVSPVSLDLSPSSDMLICIVIAAAGTAITAGASATQSPRKSTMMRVGFHFIKTNYNQ